MSIEAMSYALSLDVGHPTRKQILLGYANHAHADGTVSYAKPATIARYANCSERTVQRHRNDLLQSGLLREGDQRLVDHLPRHGRPIVWRAASQQAAAASRGRRRGRPCPGRSGRRRGPGSPVRCAAPDSRWVRTWSPMLRYAASMRRVSSSTRRRWRRSGAAQASRWAVPAARHRSHASGGLTPYQRCRAASTASAAGASVCSAARIPPHHCGVAVPSGTASSHSCTRITPSPSPRSAPSPNAASAGSTGTATGRPALAARRSRSIARVSSSRHPSMASRFTRYRPRSVSSRPVSLRAYRTGTRGAVGAASRNARATVPASGAGGVPEI
ncbi:helix-turn-helix domain-containing protein [Actinocatenispora sera]|uniref:helix-turn-helix domain-containing protein n=1 Tax=Actinocatenispora sera TaxID=390989 RepID=UPI003CC7DE61